MRDFFVFFPAHFRLSVRSKFYFRKFSIAPKEICQKNDATVKFTFSQSFYNFIEKSQFKNFEVLEHIFTHFLVIATVIFLKPNDGAIESHAVKELFSPELQPGVEDGNTSCDMEIDSTDLHQAKLLMSKDDADESFTEHFCIPVENRT